MYILENKKILSSRDWKSVRAIHHDGKKARFHVKNTNIDKRTALKYAMSSTMDVANSKRYTRLH